MKKLFLTFLIIISLPFCANAAEISAHSAVLIDMNTGTVYYEKNADEVMPMASTTKIMTTLLALENCEDLQEFFKVSDSAIMVEGTSMGLQKGDSVNMYALCVGMLLSSGNDAANMTAVKISGSVSEFVKLMNARAKEMGLKNTSFETPSGLDGEHHHTTAKELAAIARIAMQNPTFREICSKIKIQVEFGAPPYKRTLYNHNRLLRSYEGTLGIKTGFTKKSGRCLVSACQRNGVSLICVTLNAPNDWSDHTKLYDEAFSNLTSVTLKTNDDYSVPVTGGNLPAVKLKMGEAFATVKNGEEGKIITYIEMPPFVYAPVKVGDICGEAVFISDGKEIARAPLYAAETVNKTKPKGFFDKLFDFFK